MEKTFRRKVEKTVTAIILAAGNSRRLDVSFKQFEKIKGKALLFYSLEKFLDDRGISRIIIAVPKSKLMYSSSIIARNYSDPRIELIAGGSTRKESSFNALKYLEPKRPKTDYVVIHDASRPLITKEMIRLVIKEAATCGAAVVGKSAIDLIFQVKNGYVKKAFRKEAIHYGYTPQCFKFSRILRAHYIFRGEAIMKNADNIELLLAYDKKSKIKMIDNFYPNLKLTYKEDVKMIKPFLR